MRWEHSRWTFLLCFKNTVWHDQRPDIPKRPEFVLLETRNCNPALVKPVCPVWEKVVTLAAVTELILSWVSLPAPPGGLSYSESKVCFLYCRITPCHKSRHCPSESKAQELEWDFRALPATLWGRSPAPSQSYVTEEPEVQTLSPGGFDQARLYRYVFGD